VGEWALWLVVVGGGIAQAQTIDARVDKTRLTIEESLQLTVTISGGGQASLGEVDLGALEKTFEIVNRSSSQNINMVGNQVSVSQSINFLLMPRAVGKFKIGPLSVNYGGRTLKTQVIEVEVVGERGREVVEEREREGVKEPERVPVRGDLDIETTVDKKEPYVHEQVIVTFHFYNRARLMDQPTYEPPEMNGFRVEELGSEGPVQEIVAGQAYSVQRIRYAAFPLQSGELTIGPARLQLGLFDGNRILQTRPVTLKVKPLPEGQAPANFKGAVGQFKLTAGLDRGEVPVGEPVKLKVTISGTGDLKSVPDFDLPSQSGFRQYSASQEERTTVAGNRCGGEKVTEFVLVPRAEGVQTIGPLEFSFFDPQAGKYRTAQAGPLTLRVTPGTVEEEGGAGGFAPAAVKLLRRDIRYIKPSLGRRDETGWGVVKRPSFWGFHALPVVVLLGVAGYQRRRAALAADTPYARAVRSNRAAKKWLKEAEKLLGEEESVAFHEAVAKGMREYVATKANVPLATVAADTVGDLLRAFEVEEEMVGEVRACLEECEFAKFSGRGTGREGRKTTLERARRCLEGLERAKRRAEG